MVLAGFRRLATILGAVVGATVVLSLILGVAAGSSAARAVSVGLYVLGIMLLVGCFVFGVRGPLRGVSSSGDPTPMVAARRIRQATPEERTESMRLSLWLFVIGLAIVLVGTVIDPSHQAF